MIHPLPEPGEHVRPIRLPDVEVEEVDTPAGSVVVLRIGDELFAEARP